MAARVAASATVRAVKARKPFPSRAALVLTPSAATRVKQLSEGKDDHIGLRIGVKQRGCNGFSYTLDFTAKKDKFDEEVLQDGVRIFVDIKAQLHLLGTVMDYVENELSSEFVFNNPNIKGICGCGESFSV